MWYIEVSVNLFVFCLQQHVENRIVCNYECWVWMNWNIYLYLLTFIHVYLYMHFILIGHLAPQYIWTLLYMYTIPIYDPIYKSIFTAACLILCLFMELPLSTNTICQLFNSNSKKPRPLTKKEILVMKARKLLREKPDISVKTIEKVTCFGQTRHMACFVFISHFNTW